MNPNAPNPYAAPVAQPAAGDDKKYRTNLINRRTTAVLLEFAVYNVTVAPALALLMAFAHLPETANWLTWVGLAAWWLARDVTGIAPFFHRLVGLRLVAGEGDDGPAPGAGARVLRNVTLVLPFMPLVEYFVAYYGDAQMRRLGDRIAGTRMVDVDRARRGQGTASLMMLGALVLNAALAIIGTRLAAGFAPPR